MSARLKESYIAAENDLPEAGQEQLAKLMDAFRANYPPNANAHFSAEELEQIRKLDDEPVDDGDPATMRAFFAKYGVAPKYEL